MKLNVRLVSLAVLTLLLAGAIVYAERSRPREITLPVQGMVCEGCEQHLRAKLLDAPGIQSVVPSHEDARVTIVVSGWSRVDEVKLREIIKRAGYEPE
jgi:copper chaperone CopZ